MPTRSIADDWRNVLRCCPVLPQSLRTQSSATGNWAQVFRVYSPGQRLRHKCFLTVGTEKPTKGRRPLLPQPTASALPRTKLGPNLVLTVVGMPV